MTNTHKNKQHEPPRMRIDCLATREKLLRILEGDAIHYEKNMPDVQIGALCRATFLRERGYVTIGQNRLFKRESNDRSYLFLAVQEVESQTITSIQNHPIYELEAMSN